MVMNPNVLPSDLPSQLKVTLILETLASGKIAASVLEFPNCRVEAQARETAISQLQAIFLERLQHIEAIAWSVPVVASKPAWLQFAGIFRDDPDFLEIMDAIRAERTSDDDSEIEPSYYL